MPPPPGVIRPGSGRSTVQSAAAKPPGTPAPAKPPTPATAQTTPENSETPQVAAIGSVLIGPITIPAFTVSAQGEGGEIAPALANVISSIFSRLSPAAQSEIADALSADHDQSEGEF